MSSTIILESDESLEAEVLVIIVVRYVSFQEMLLNFLLVAFLEKKSI